MSTINPRILLSLILGVFRYGSLESVEVLLAILTILWGAYLFMPWVSFAESIEALPHILHIEYIWGGVFFFAGIAKLYMITISDTMARWAALIGAVLWSFVFLLYSFGNVNTAPVVYLLVVLANIWVFLRRGRVIR